MWQRQKFNKQQRGIKEKFKKYLLKRWPYSAALGHHKFTVMSRIANETRQLQWMQGQTDRRIGILVLVWLVNIIIKFYVFNSGLSGPGKDFGTRLTRTHVTHARLMPGVAHFGRFAFLRSLRVIALEGFEALDTIERGGIAHPLDRLPVGRQPYVIHGHDCVKEGHETFFVVRRREPGRMVIQWERSPVNIQMSICQCLSENSS